MTIALALVGGAHIHTPGFIERLKKRPQLRVKSVWDHDSDRAKRCAAALEAVVAGELSEIWDDPQIAAAVICSETFRHLPLVLAGAAAGKHLFVEKPLGIDAQDAAAMARAIEEAGVIFQTGYFMRGDPILRFIKSQLELGNFGEVTRCRLSNCHAGALKGWFDTDWRWMADMAQAGVGGFGDLGTHILDILLWWFGEVSSVTATLGVATGRYGEIDEYGEGLLVFKNTLVGSLAAGWADIANPFSLEVSGTAGHATVVNGQLFFQSERVPGADGKTPWQDLPPALPHAFDLFLDAVSGKANQPLVSAGEAAYRSEVMEALYRAARTDSWVRLGD